MLGLSTSQIEQIMEKLQTFDLQAVILFGSRARGDFKTGSDVDLAFKGNLDLTTLAHIKAVLEEETDLPYFFDVVNYNTLENLELKRQIDTQGQILWQKT